MDPEQVARNHAEHHVVVEPGPSYVVVEKVGRAAEVAEEMDPREASHG